MRRLRVHLIVLIAAALSSTAVAVLHIDLRGDWGGTQWFFDNILLRQVEFDIIGESYSTSVDAGDKRYPKHAGDIQRDRER